MNGADGGKNDALVVFLSLVCFSLRKVRLVERFGRFQTLTSTHLLGSGSPLFVFRMSCANGLEAFL